MGANGVALSRIVKFRCIQLTEVHEHLILGDSGGQANSLRGGDLCEVVVGLGMVIDEILSQILEELILTILYNELPEPDHLQISLGRILQEAGVIIRKRRGGGGGA